MEALLNMSFEEKLICEVQKYPVLYVKRVGGYKTVAKKFRIWNTIGEELGQPGKLKYIIVVIC